jgi:hypothetical protein
MISLFLQGIKHQPLIYQPATIPTELFRVLDVSLNANTAAVTLEFFRIRPSKNGTASLIEKWVVTSPFSIRSDTEGIAYSARVSGKGLFFFNGYTVLSIAIASLFTGSGTVFTDRKSISYT